MVKHSFYYSFFVTFLSMLVVPSRTRELFSAVFQMESLMETHKFVADQLRAVIDQEQSLLDSYKRILQRYEEDHKESQNDFNKYLGNPLNTFMLIKQLTVGLDDLNKMLNVSVDSSVQGLYEFLPFAVEALGPRGPKAKIFFKELAPKFIEATRDQRAVTYFSQSISKAIQKGNAASFAARANAKKLTNFPLVKKGLSYPTEGDLTGAATALGRLQEFYKLNTTELAAGYINGEKISRNFSFDDCTYLARHLYHTDKYQLAISWMQEALRKCKEIGPVNLHVINEMLDFIAFTYYQLGHLESARDWTLKILKSEPSDLRARSNLKHYQRILHQRKQTQAGKRIIYNDEDSTIKKSREKYHDVCRGHFEFLPNITKSLKCYYMDENHAFLKIAPFKVEELYNYPKAYIVHDAITNDEIDFIKTISIPQMTRAKVVQANGVGAPSQHRTSQISWIYDRDHPRLAVISRRTGHFTGLCMDFAEPLQVNNYGIGGHYDLHSDYDWHEDSSKSFDTTWEDRFSTVLFYLSDVEQGGATAFPMLGLAVFPKKGSALVWNNLHPSGLGNELTLHAACPVLLGDKWVANKWISTSGQELLHPCHLDRKYGLNAKAASISRKLPISEDV